MKPLPTLEEAIERLSNRRSLMSTFTPEQLTAMAKAEEECTCKHCGRCVLAGPPCCYDAVYELWQKAASEVAWLRKVQSKNTKLIAELRKKLASSQ